MVDAHDDKVFLLQLKEHDLRKSLRRVRSCRAAARANAHHKKNQLGTWKLKPS
jgi:hypothetical protein